MPVHHSSLIKHAATTPGLSNSPQRRRSAACASPPPWQVRSTARIAPVLPSSSTATSCSTADVCRVSILDRHVRNLAEENVNTEEATDMAAEASVAAEAAGEATKAAAKAQASAKTAGVEDAAKLAQVAAMSAAQAQAILEAAPKHAAAEAAADEEATRGTFRGWGTVVKALLLTAVAWAAAEATAAVGASATTVLAASARTVRPVRVPSHFVPFPLSFPHPPVFKALARRAVDLSLHNIAVAGDGCSRYRCRVP